MRQLQQAPEARPVEAHAVDPRPTEARPAEIRPVVPGLSLPPPAAPCLEDFLTGREDDRLRDLLAFAMAVEAGRPTEPEAMRGKAEAELQAHAFRTLHNQAETIRLEAAREQLSRSGRSLGFTGSFAASLLALLFGASILLVLWSQRANLMPLLPAGIL
ncbi:hypothetical protein ACLF3G_19360 [Falsiroseomonas sp. HC035]|uniref:hypothetical protein n=1 Tax=Falsiroseomonas sp. HC035 TaxID=3390999 RepID=UPI003D3126AB